MTPEQFCYWLQGRAEMQPGNPPSAEEWQMIRDHLATVFNKVTPHVQIPQYIPSPPRDSTATPTWERYRTECKASGAGWMV